MYRIPSVAVFKAVAGNARLVYFCSFPASSGYVLFSPDGQSYWPVEHHGISGIPSVHEMRGTVIGYDGRECVIRRRGDIVTCGDERYVFQKDAVVDMTDLVGMPRRRQPVYVCRTPRNDFVFVSAEVNDPNDETFRLFVGSGRSMRPVEVKSGGVERKPGGELVIHTAERTFVGIAPSDVLPGTPRVPGWGDSELEHADQTYLIMTETLDGDLKITKI